MAAALTLAVPILLPLAAAVVAAGWPRAAHRVAGVVAIGQIAAAIQLARTVWLHGTVTHQVGAWPPPLGIPLRADGLAAVMVVMTAVVGTAITAYAAPYFAKGSGDGARPPGHGFWPLWLMLWGGLHALFLAGDVFNLYVTLEVISLAGVGLISLAGRSAWIPAMRYLLVSLLASLSYLLGVALLYGQYGVLDLALLAQVVEPNPVTWTAAGLMITALMAKTALVPLHVWLPPAHAGAPAPVSAILSALVLKASFYLLVRLWFEAFPALGLVEAGRVAGALGAAAIVWGSWLALRQTRLKQVVAYSTVAQVGYLFLLFPLATGAGVSAVPAAVTLHMVSHACAKAAMFMAAGALMGAYGSDDVSRLRGAAVHGSWSALAFALGAMVLIGVPPGGNFLAKWMLIDAAVRTGQWWWVAAIAAGTLMAAAYLFRILKIFMASDGSTAPPTAPGHALGVPALALAGLALALMLAAPAISGLLEHAPPAGLPRAAAALEVRP